jgi:predicted AlkP superfamily pyrophosphatase or phosphodiesterase
LKLDMRRGGRDQYTGRNTTERAVAALEVIGSKPFFLFIHYKAADVLGHRVGDRSRQYREAIIQNDLQLWDLLLALIGHGLLTTTEIYVTTDHGFHGGLHTQEADPLVTNVWFASLRHNLIATSGSMLDVTPTVLRQLGIPLSIANPRYRGRPLSR